MKIGVIADDLTGANDTAIQFAKLGLRSLVLLDFESDFHMIEKWDVLVVDTNSRLDNPDSAYRKVRMATKFLKQEGAQVYYKKIDSTLRGNIGSELDAVMDELNNNLSFVIPAFPATGRITIDGYQLVHGRLLEKTEIAHDPLTPMKISHVPTIIGRQTNRKVGQVRLDEIRRSLTDLSKKIAKLNTNGYEIIVFDAETQKDLRKIASLYPSQYHFEVVCGPAGFAEELAKRTGIETEMPTLTVAGSLSQVTADQVETLRSQLKTRIIELDIIRSLKAGENLEQEIDEIIDNATEILSEGYDLVIRPQDPKTVRRVLQGGTSSLGEDIASSASKIILLLGRITNEILERSEVSGLVLTGGDTARGVCRVINAEVVKIDNEVSPGIPSGVIIGGEQEGLRIVTKAGSFGEETALVDSVLFLKRKAQSKIK
ncbi:MAG: four-carbon acid sugar kinase family protein [Candidatus Bathyarchaeota archaeon]|nr:MAG: four-carbon acid sugar kinase family protein [Candidatus Bathyarchaeota archaeon]